ncbi:hypothetical protein MASR2M117_15550 [Paludibacter sp.]
MSDQLVSSDVRISWDKNSYQELASYVVSENNSTLKTAYYSRIKRLSDGSLLMVYMNNQYGYNIYTRKSTDDGKTWSNASWIRKQYNEASQVSSTDKIVFACPDFIELDNGEVLLAYQWRYNSAYANITYTNVSCGIETMKSNDYGNTWAEPRRIYYGRNWEPSFIKSPSGELQMLFTDSHEVTAGGVSRPCVSLLRSFDNGNTWQNKEVCTYEDATVLSRTVNANGTYDGMPVGKYLANNNGIAYACESWGVSQTPWIVYSTVSANWMYNDFDFATGGPGPNRRWLVHSNFQGHAPYMEVLPSGEVIVQANGKYNGVSGIWTFIGDEYAKNFSNASSPYSGWWGSVSYIGNDEIISTANYDYKTGSLSYEGIKVIKGKLNYSKTIRKNPLQLQALSSFDRNMNKDWFIGEETTSSAYVNFGYTDAGFEYTVHLFDSILTAFTPTNADAVVIRLARKHPVSGVYDNYQMVANALGGFSLEKKTSYIWTIQDVSSVKDITVNLEGTVNNMSDIDTGYALKVSVPWNLIGGYPAENEEIRVHLRQRYKDVVTESPMASVAYMAGEDMDDSSTWLKLTIDYNTWLDKINSDEEQVVSVRGDLIYVTTPVQIEHVSVYNLYGQRLVDIHPVEEYNKVNLQKGVYILSYKEKGGTVRGRKVLLR